MLHEFYGDGHDTVPFNRWVEDVEQAASSAKARLWLLVRRTAGAAKELVTDCIARIEGEADVVTDGAKYARVVSELESLYAPVDRKRAEELLETFESVEQGSRETMAGYVLRKRAACAEYHNAQRAEGTFSKATEVDKASFHKSVIRNLTRATREFINLHGAGRKPALSVVSALPEILAMMRAIDPNRAGVGARARAAVVTTPREDRSSTRTPRSSSPNCRPGTPEPPRVSARSIVQDPDDGEAEEAEGRALLGTASIQGVGLGSLRTTIAKKNQELLIEGVPPRLDGKARPPCPPTAEWQRRDENGTRRSVQEWRDFRSHPSFAKALNQSHAAGAQWWFVCDVCGYNGHTGRLCSGHGGKEGHHQYCAFADTEREIRREVAQPDNTQNVKAIRYKPQHVYEQEREQRQNRTPRLSGRGTGGGTRGGRGRGRGTSGRGRGTNGRGRGNAYGSVPPPAAAGTVLRARAVQGAIMDADSVIRPPSETFVRGTPEDSRGREHEREDGGRHVQGVYRH